MNVDWLGRRMERVGAGDIVYGMDGRIVHEADDQPEPQPPAGEVFVMPPEMTVFTNGNWVQRWQESLMANALEIGNSIPLNFTYKVNNQAQAIMLRICQANRHILLEEGVEFCPRCCWKCQMIETAPFCDSCRKELKKAMREETRPTMRAWASTHFPDIRSYIE